MTLQLPRKLARLALAAAVGSGVGGSVVDTPDAPAPTPRAASAGADAAPIAPGLRDAMAAREVSLPTNDELPASATLADRLGWSLERAEVGFPRMPSISPDGSVIAFSWAGDLWAVPAGGGVASRLTSHPADELRSAFSPDGSILAFESTRDGSRNLYAMPVVLRDGRVLGGDIRRLTLSDRALTLSGFTADGTALLAHGGLHRGAYRGSRMYRVPIAGGPITPLSEAHGSFPVMSPDGSRVLFTRKRDLWDRPAYRGSAAGELWAMDTASGAFERLTTFDGTDAHGHALANGAVVYVSSRHGQNNLWLLPPGKTDADGPRRLTSFAPEGGELTIGHGVRDLDVGVGGRTAVFCVWDTVYTLDLASPAAKPRPVTIYASGDSDALDTRVVELDRQVSEAQLSPDGKTLAVIARGEVFVRSTEEDHPSRRVTFTTGRERDLAWSPDNRYLYFASDQSGEYAIHRAQVALAREDLRPEPDTSDETIEELPADEPADDQPANEPGGAPTDQPAETPAATEPEDPEAADAQDGAQDGDEADAPEADEPIDYGTRWADALRFDVEPLIATDAMEHRPTPSPDGRRLLFLRERGDVWLHDFATGQRRLVLESWNEPDVQWAPDGRHIIYEVADLDFNADIWLLDALDPEAAPINITRHPDIDTSPRLSADGKVLAFLSDRGGENWSYEVHMVPLDHELEGLADYELARYFEDAAKAAKKRGPIDPPDLEAARDADDHADADDQPTAMAQAARDAWKRIRRLTSVGGARDLAITPGGERILFEASIDGDTALYSVDYRGRERKTVQPGGVSGVSVARDGASVLFVRGGQAGTAKPAGGSGTTLAIDATVRLDVAAEQEQKFRDAAAMLGRNFYHPTMKGLDWQALTERYMALARATRTNDEFHQVADMLFGELNGSHLGIWGGAETYDPPAIRTGYLGVDTRPVAGGYEVVRVLPDGPASLPGSRLAVGDVITAVNGQPLAGDGGVPAVDLREAMASTAGVETLLDVLPADPEDSRFVLIVPTGSGAEAALRYQADVADRRRTVEDLSGGRLGYLHIRGMNASSLRDFERDLYAAAAGRDGLLIDVRDNGGGWTTDILLASLTAPRHAYTVPRGADPTAVPQDAYPRDRRLIYGYNRPIAVLCNQNSFSNAEIFSHAIKTTGRGPLVGETTFGGVISTGSYRLIDGTTVRRPFRGWYLPDGTDMENNGAKPDVRVPLHPGDDAEGSDTQLRAAVAALLEGLDQ